MKNKGFTLTEMIAVIVIIGVIITITIPVTNRIINNNKEEKYTFYVGTVEKAIYAYADLEFPLTVSSKSVQLSELINRDYLKEFNEDGVTVADSNFSFKKTNGKVEFVDKIADTKIDDIEIEFKKNGNTIKTCTKTACK